MEDVNRPFTAMWNVRYGNAVSEDEGGRRAGVAGLRFFVCVTLIASNCSYG